jgi:ABC-type antimicrobial peptide transport system permease subunit
LSDDYIGINYVNTGSEYVTKRDLLNCLSEIDDISNELREQIIQYDVEGIIDNNSYEFKFLYCDGKFKVAEEFKENLKKYDNLTEGTYWSDYEEANGICVALISDPAVFGEISALDSIKYVNQLKIGGKIYDIIGKQAWNEKGAMFPFSTVADEQLLTSTLISFNSAVSVKTYNQIRDVFNNYMGDKAVFEEIRTIDKDTYYTYKTVILISVFIALIAAINFMILYRYIMSTRKRTTAIFRILGLTPAKLNFMNMSECIILIVPFFILGMVLYQTVFLPRLHTYFVYMQDAYTPFVYFLLFVIFISVSLIVIGIMLLVMSRKRILELIKDRG